MCNEGGCVVMTNEMPDIIVDLPTYEQVETVKQIVEETSDVIIDTNGEKYKPSLIEKCMEMSYYPIGENQNIIDIDENFIYVIHSSNNLIYKYDTDFNLINTLTWNVSNYGTLPTNARDWGYDSDNLYISVQSGSNFRLFKISKSDFALEMTSQISTTIGMFNRFCIIDDKIYCLSAGRTAIYIYDKYNLATGSKGVKSYSRSILDIVNGDNNHVYLLMRTTSGQTNISKTNLDGTIMGEFTSDNTTWVSTNNTIGTIKAANNDFLIFTTDQHVGKVNKTTLQIEKMKNATAVSQILFYENGLLETVNVPQRIIHVTDLVENVPKKIFKINEGTTITSLLKKKDTYFIAGSRETIYSFSRWKIAFAVSHYVKEVIK